MFLLKFIWTPTSPCQFLPVWCLVFRPSPHLWRWQADLGRATRRPRCGQLARSSGPGPGHGTLPWKRAFTRLPSTYGHFRRENDGLDIANVATWHSFDHISRCFHRIPLQGLRHGRVTPTPDPILVDQAADTFHTTAACQTSNGWLGDSLKTRLGP